MQPGNAGNNPPPPPPAEVCSSMRHHLPLLLSPPYRSPQLEQLALRLTAQYSTSDQITASVPDQPANLLAGNSGSLVALLRSLIRHLTVHSLVPRRVWPCIGLESTSITAERKICQTTSINIRTLFSVISRLLLFLK